MELSSRDKWTSSAFFVSYFERSVEKNINSDFVMENRLTMCLECWDPVFIYIVNYQRPILLGYLNLTFSYIMKKGCALNKEENSFMWGPLWPVLVGVKWHNRRRGIVPFCFVFLCISCFCFISCVWILASFFPPHGKRARFAYSSAARAVNMEEHKETSTNVNRAGFKICAVFLRLMFANVSKQKENLTCFLYHNGQNLADCAQ